MSQYQMPGAVSGPPQGPPPGPQWGAPPGGRSNAQWAAIGVGAFGLLVALISLALPWQYQRKEAERYSLGFYYDVSSSAGDSYPILLAVLVLVVIALQYVPPAWNMPLRISGTALALLLIAQVSGIMVNVLLDGAKNEDQSHLGMGLFLSYLALLPLGVAALISPPNTPPPAQGRPMQGPPAQPYPPQQMYPQG